ncbi:MAG: hypothetical protein ABIF04_05715 [Chloroflexota bacterium]
MPIIYILLTIYSVFSLALGVATPHFLNPISTSVSFTFALLYASQRIRPDGTPDKIAILYLA